MIEPFAADAPSWFLEAIATPFEARSVEVAGASIHYQYWDARRPSLPGILLVHGNGAHARWWDFIAPALLDRYRVAALDLSGNGNSAHRAQYSLALYAEEVAAVAEDTGFGDSVILVGHSFGGTVCRMSASLHRERLRALILIDSAVSTRRRGAPATRRLPRGREVERLKPPRIYESREEAARRFRLRPPQPCANGFILSYLARHSVGRVDGGWGWKTDHRVFSKLVHPPGTSVPDLATLIQAWNLPVGIIYGEKSRFFTAQVVKDMREVAGRDRMVEVADAHHHLFLDQPQAFVAALNQLLEGCLA